MKKPDFTVIGKKFHALTVMSYEFTKNGVTYWKCRCDCGNIKVLQRGHIPRTQSCGCIRSRRMKEVNKRNIKPTEESGGNSIYKTYVCHSRRLTRVFDISKRDFKFLISRTCVYCGAFPNNQHVNQNTKQIFFYNGVDRVDNDRGYTLDNCVPCCKICNYAKGGMTHEEFIQYLNGLVKYRNSLSQDLIDDFPYINPQDQERIFEAAKLRKKLNTQKPIEEKVKDLIILQHIEANANPELKKSGLIPWKI